MKNIPLSSVKTVKLGIQAIEVERIRGGKRRRRNAKLAWQNPLCVQCEADGLVSRATEWDHIVPLHLGGPDSEDNLQGLCRPHHEEKTAREAAHRAGKP